MQHEPERPPLSLDRRSLAVSLAAAAAGTLLLGSQAAAEVTFEISSATEAFVEAALSVTPARLSPEQRLDVRNGVRSLQKSLAEARTLGLDEGVEPASIFRPEGVR